LKSYAERNCLLASLLQRSIFSLSDRGGFSGISSTISTGSSIIAGSSFFQEKIRIKINIISNNNTPQMMAKI
jgi:hypothetical protein